MKIALAQFSNIKPNDKIFNKYLSNVFKNQKISMLIIGDYVCNLFFKEYENKDTKELKSLFEGMHTYLKSIASKYNTTLIAPIIEYKNNKLYKSIFKINKSNSTCHRLGRVMHMPHWNEKKFFNNRRSEENLIFELEEFKIAILSGWECHFNSNWERIKNNNVDVVVVPTASTFDSNQRWATLLQTQSFLANCFVIRVNRIGNYLENGINWEFYGNSFISLPDGNLGDVLGMQEGILISELNKDLILESISNWGFRNS